MREAFNLTQHLAFTDQSPRGRRAFAARLNATLKRSNVTSGRLAKALSVAENVVDFWRRGILLPSSNDFRRLCDVLRLDIRWLCLGGDTGVVDGVSAEYRTPYTQRH